MLQIIFRDFKSSNILLDENWKAKLSDFGLARLGPSEGLTHVSTDVSSLHSSFGCKICTRLGHSGLRTESIRVGYSRVGVYTSLFFLVPVL